MTNPSRRDFLKLTSAALLSASGLLGLAGFFKFLDFQAGSPRNATFDLGPLSKYPKNSRTLLPEIPALLIRSETGFSALSLVCTHLGCTVNEQPGGFTCPCHASRYDRDGRVLKGPAKEPLRSLNVELTGNDHLILRLD